MQRLDRSLDEAAKENKKQKRNENGKWMINITLLEAVI